ncbi:hypothetical protein AB0A95_33445 [Micromonospora sp. NPDC049230]|uniref:hypothetical protein n=1 Tax=Micromonospora sp. NPDC049230 TaxID=3155502 RepID=UPI0033D4768E
MTREMTPKKAAVEIRRAYGTYTTQHGQGEWIFISDIADRVDLTREEIHAGIRHLKATDQRFNLIPESNQKVLRPIEREYAIQYGNQAKHLISWDPESSTVERIRDAYAHLADRVDSYVSLVDVRARLSDLPRAEVDAALRELFAQDRVQLEPEPFAPRTGPAERAAAIEIGGEDRHHLRVEPAYR